VSASTKFVMWSCCPASPTNSEAQPNSVIQIGLVALEAVIWFRCPRTRSRFVEVLSLVLALAWNETTSRNFEPGPSGYTADSICWKMVVPLESGSEERAGPTTRVPGALLRISTAAACR
jgi:hypothetical protein